MHQIRLAHHRPAHQLDNVLVRESLHRLRLEAGHVLILNGVAGDPLERHLAPGFRVAGELDGAEAALSQLAEDLVADALDGEGGAEEDAAHAEEAGEEAGPPAQQGGHTSSSTGPLLSSSLFFLLFKKVHRLSQLRIIHIFHL